MTKRAKKIKSYVELMRLKTYDERLEYLKTYNTVGEATFGDRQVNQEFYHSKEWRRVKRDIIIRDGCCDMALSEFPIGDERINDPKNRKYAVPYVHHINPVTQEMVEEMDPLVLDPDNLITVCYDTHQVIHYGPKSQNEIVERRPNDTCPWKV